jgi:hypothetical protein
MPQATQILSGPPTGADGTFRLQAGRGRSPLSHTNISARLSASPRTGPCLYSFNSGQCTIDFTLQALSLGR